MIPTMVLLILIYAYIFSGVRTGSEQVIYGCRGGGMQALVCSQVAAITCFTQIRATFGLVLIGPLKGGQANLPSL